MFSKWLFQLSKNPFIGRVAGYGFQFCSFLLPVKKLSHTKKVICFFHPKPSYKRHMLIIPKKSIPTLLHLAEKKNQDYIRSVWNTAKSMADKHFRDHFVLCSNGGPRQEVMQVHFHMFLDEVISDKHVSLPHGEEYIQSDIKVMQLNAPPSKIHLLLTPASQIARESFDDFLVRAIALLPDLDNRYELRKKGFTYIVQGPLGVENKQVHVMAGK